jgi:hypothetical protein
LNQTQTDISGITTQLKELQHPMKELSGPLAEMNSHLKHLNALMTTILITTLFAAIGALGTVALLAFRFMHKAAMKVPTQVG